MRPIISILAVTAVLAATIVCCAQETPSTSRATPHAAVLERRVVKTFDFDERSLGNYGPTPAGWDKVQQVGFPHFVKGRLDENRGHPAPCFAFELNGGNLGYRFEQRRIPVFPGSDHKIVAYVTTTGLAHARGYIEAFYMDRFGAVLTDTVRYSTLIGPPNETDPEWRKIEVELPFINPDGRFIGLAIYLVQQDHLPNALALPVKSYRKDIDAQMLVDQITIFRLPRCRLNLPQNKALYTTDEPVTVQAVVADPLPDDLTARLVIIDEPTGMEMELQHQVKVLPPLDAILQGTAQEPLLADHQLGLLPPGAYRAVLQVLSDNEVIINRERRIAVAQPVAYRAGYGQEHFGIDLTAENEADANEATEYLRRLGVSWALVPIWKSGIQLNAVSSEQSLGDQLATQLNRAAITVIGAYMGTPEELALKTGLLNPSIWDLFSQNRDRWSSELALVLSRHADRIDHWVFGHVDNCWQSPYPDTDAVLTSLRDEFGQFQGQFWLMPVWPAMVAPTPESQADGFVLRLPRELLPIAYEDYFSAWADRRNAVWLVLDETDLDHLSLNAALLDLCRRVIVCKRYGFDRIAWPAPWRKRLIHNRAVFEPRSDFPVMANLIQRLAGLTYGGTVQLNDSVRAWLFVGDQRSVMVVMSHRSETLQSTVTLSRDLRAYDMWGRTLPLTADDNRWSLQYDRLAFIEGIDADLARFIASVRFDPPTVSSRFGSHFLQLAFDNTFSQSVSGDVRVWAGQNWRFEPPGGTFALPGGRAHHLPMKVRYPSNEPIGGKLIDVKFTLEARHQVKLNLLVPLELGLADLKMRVLWYLRNGQLVLSQEIRNTGDEWVDLETFVVAPDQPQEPGRIRGLGPSGVAVKEYVLGPWEQMHGRSVRVGFREVRGDRMVNQLVTLE